MLRLDVGRIFVAFLFGKLQLFEHPVFNLVGIPGIEFIKLFLFVLQQSIFS